MLKMPIPGKFSSLFGWTIKGKKIGAFYIFLQVFNSKLARFTTNVIKWIVHTRPLLVLKLLQRYLLGFLLNLAFLVQLMEEDQS